MDAEQIKAMIEAGMAGAEVQVQGDGSHFQALVVSDSFADKSIVQQHQMVYQTLGDAMREAIHALSLRTLTPEGWKEAKKRPF
ncbi:MAG: BolA/IbaG family iron-sulfur metabolism protein [Gammaproteobacteria bacterium]|nr:BolA/IbaG family iron-sulfur metabolism protein [Gammaproteobacteria bacterium]